MEERSDHPLFLRLRGRLVIVIGGGAVAERKVLSVLECGAVVRVVAPTLTPELGRLAAGGQLQHRPRSYRSGDIAGAVLAFVATDDREENASAAWEARDLGIPVNVADEPDLCTFVAPAVLRRGRLAIAISTGGASPAWARRIKEDLAEMYGEEYGRLFEAIAAVRQRSRELVPDPVRRRKVLMRLADRSLVELARSKGPDEVESEILGLVARWSEEMEAEGSTGKGRPAEGAAEEDPRGEEPDR